MRTIDEHNELYGKIIEIYLNKKQKEPLVLIHIDEHADFNNPIVTEELLLSDVEEDIETLIHEQLRISDFILPLVFKGVINEILWVSNEDQELDFYFYVIKKELKNGKVLLRSIVSRETPEEEVDLCHFIKTTINSSRTIQIDRSHIVSVDLDYFICDDVQGEKVIVETTKAEYEAYKTNKLHPLRLKFGSRFKIEKIEGKLFGVIDDHIEYAGSSREDVDINVKIGHFANYLKNMKLKPIEIFICRSVLSGYVPLEVANRLESTVSEICLKDLGWGYD